MLCNYSAVLVALEICEQLLLILYKVVKRYDDLCLVFQFGVLGLGVHG